MDTVRIIEIFRLLAEGIDPQTGEILPKESPYDNPETIRALYQSIEILQKKEKNREKIPPQRSGEKWTEQEDKDLIASFKNNIPINELAKIHKRSKGAIFARLMKHGKIKVE